MTQTEDELRPAPTLTADNRFFWEAAAEGKLVIQACGDCEQLCHPPAPLCPRCHSSNRMVREMSGAGHLASYINVHHPPNPWFELPIVVATVELDEGVNVISNLCDIPFDEIELGMEVEVFFAPTEDGLGVPLFRPRTR